MTELKATKEDVVSAYRLILGRQPDDPGLMHYLTLVDKGISVDHLAKVFKASPEHLSRYAVKRERVEIGDGLYAAVDANEQDFGRFIVDNGGWEPHVVAVIRANLKPGDTYVDIGANVGVMAFNAAQVVGPSGKVIAFEPNTKNATMFLRGVLENRFENVVLLPLAASNYEGVVSLSTDSSNTYLLKDTRGGDLVQTIRADRILAAEDHVHFIKIDIEGFEPFALAGLAETLKRWRPFVLCEFNPRCLRDNAATDYRTFADALFRITNQITAIDFAGEEHVVRDGLALAGLWQAKNRNVASKGLLPDGMLHLDLLFKADV